jgi:hypothetical protein
VVKSGAVVVAAVSFAIETFRATKKVRSEKGNWQGDVPRKSRAEEKKNGLLFGFGEAKDLNSKGPFIRDTTGKEHKVGNDNRRGGAVWVLATTHDRLFGNEKHSEMISSALGQGVIAAVKQDGIDAGTELLLPLDHSTKVRELNAPLPRLPLQTKHIEPISLQSSSKRTLKAQRLLTWQGVASFQINVVLSHYVFRFVLLCVSLQRLGC